MTIYQTTDRSLINTLERLTSAYGSNLYGTQTDPREEVIITYTKGTGRFDANKEFITLTMYQYKLNGEQDGYHQGVWQRVFQNPGEILDTPENPKDPLNEPKGPVPHIAPLAYTKGIWVFGDDSSITAVGPALSHLMPVKGSALSHDFPLSGDDEGLLFAVTCAQIITNGTGRFKGAQGLKTSLGSTFVKGNLFDPNNKEPFVATTIDTFRVIRKANMK